MAVDLKKEIYRSKDLGEAACIKAKAMVKVRLQGVVVKVTVEFGVKSEVVKKVIVVEVMVKDLGKFIMAGKFTRFVVIIGVVFEAMESVQVMDSNM